MRSMSRCYAALTLVSVIMSAQGFSASAMVGTMSRTSSGKCLGMQGEICAMVRVTDLARSVSFYTDVLGMSELMVEGGTSATVGYEKHPDITIKLMQTADALLLGDGYRGASYALTAPGLTRSTSYPRPAPTRRMYMPDPHTTLDEAYHITPVVERPLSSCLRLRRILPLLLP